MKISEIIKILDATILVGEDQVNRDFARGGASDLMSDILARMAEGAIILTGLTSIQVIRTSMVAGVAAVIFVRGKNPPQEVIDLARQEGIPLLSTPYSMFVSCGRLHAQGMTGLNGDR